ncbi:MAG: LmeA family phospholipid-binding protein, partial [Armatimonadota bacterium]
MIPASRFRTVARPVPFVAAVVLFSGLAADAAKEHASPGKPATNAPVTTEGVIAAIEKYVHRKFEDPQGLKVRLVPYESPEALQRGMFREVQITMDRAIFDGIAMRDMFMGGRDVVIDLNALLGRNSLRTSQREHGAIRATITEDGLNKAFEAVKMPIRQFHMTFVDGGVVATGVYKFIVG